MGGRPTVAYTDKTADISQKYRDIAGWQAITCRTVAWKGHTLQFTISRQVYNSQPSRLQNKLWIVYVTAVNCRRDSSFVDMTAVL